MGVLVDVYNVLFVSMWMCMRLPGMVVFVLVLDVLMVVQHVRVRVRGVPVSVLMTVWGRHSIALFSIIPV